MVERTTRNVEKTQANQRPQHGTNEERKKVVPKGQDYTEGRVKQKGQEDRL